MLFFFVATPTEPPMSKNAATTPLEYQNASSEVYDLCKSSTGISISPDSSGVQHVFHVMEKDSVASMVLAADTASDAERWVYTLREILRIGRARNIEMPQDDATLNRLFELVLKNLALPAAKQKEMMGTLPRKQKWQLIQMNKSSLASQALAAAIQGGGNSSSSSILVKNKIEENAEQWAQRTLHNENDEMHTLKGIRALNAAVATSGLQWLRTFHKVCFF